MSLTKPERRTSIWIGIVIGVTLSSMLFKYAIEKKNEKAALRNGAYDSNITAAGSYSFSPLPELVGDVIPNGIVIHYERNSTVTPEFKNFPTHSWVIESVGSFRSERLFILVDQNIHETDEIFFYRASEIYIKTEPGLVQSQIDDQLPPSRFRVIGKNSESSEFIVQIKEFSPLQIIQSLKELPEKYRIIKQARPIPWIP